MASFSGSRVKTLMMPALRQSLFPLPPDFCPAFSRAGGRCSDRVLAFRQEIVTPAEDFLPLSEFGWVWGVQRRSTVFNFRL